MNHTTAIRASVGAQLLSVTKVMRANEHVRAFSKLKAARADRMAFMCRENIPAIKAELATLPFTEVPYV